MLNGSYIISMCHTVPIDFSLCDWKVLNQVNLGVVQEAGIFGEVHIIWKIL